MKGGLKISEKIQKNANSKMKSLLKIDFSYLDKEELMALSTQSSANTKKYQETRRAISSVCSTQKHAPRTFEEQFDAIREKSNKSRTSFSKQ